MNTAMSTTERKNIIWGENASTDQTTKFESNGVSDVCDTIIATNDLNEDGHLLDITKTSGIYKIVNKVNGKYYVGSTDNLKRRRYNHFYELSRGKHGNSKLQRAWNKYGENSFDFLIVELIHPDLLLAIEQRYLDICKQNPTANYNIGYDAMAFFRGKTHSYDTRNRISISNKGKHHKSMDEKHHLSKIMLGRYQGANNPNYGRKHTPNEKQKMLLGRMDKTIYTFSNAATGDIFTGHRYEFGLKYGIDKYNIFNLIKGRTSIHKGWKILL